MHLTKTVPSRESGPVKTNSRTHIAIRRMKRTPVELRRSHGGPTDFAKRMECARLAAAFEYTLLMRMPGNPWQHPPLRAIRASLFRLSGSPQALAGILKICSPSRPFCPAYTRAAGNTPRKPAEAHGRSRKPKNVFHAIGRFTNVARNYRCLLATDGVQSCMNQRAAQISAQVPATSCLQWQFG